MDFLQFDNIALKDNVPYVSVVKSTNKAGVSSSMYAQPVSINSSESLLPGRVKDRNE